MMGHVFYGADPRPTEPFFAAQLYVSEPSLC